MIRDNHRLIIMPGMAHSGTTVLTYTLMQHPSIFCYTDGNESWLLENDLIPSNNHHAIEWLLKVHAPKRVLLKRPWAAMKYPEWMAEQMPHARYVYPFKTFSEIERSWSRPDACIAGFLRDAPTGEKRSFYRASLRAANRFKRTVDNFYILNCEDLVADPGRQLNILTHWLGLGAHQYNTKHIAPGQSIKKVLQARAAQSELAAGRYTRSGRSHIAEIRGKKA